MEQGRRPPISEAFWDGCCQTRQDGHLPEVFWGLGGCRGLGGCGGLGFKGM